MSQNGLVGNVERKCGSELPEFESLRFRFKIGTSNRQRKIPVVKANHIFIPLSPTQAKLFDQTMSENGWKKRVSTAGGMIHHNDKHVSLFGFYPFGKGSTNHRAARNGIGTKVHQGIAEYLRRNNPAYTIAWEGSVSPLLRRQLKKIGLKNGKKYPIQTYLKIIQRHAERQQKQS
ncbi:MAG: hypothetical protein Q8R15_00360 [Candidatus Micrarchaeota archaeon]|nr:hypothetical protein [Candidatus Micrarchaeota archaeon]